MSALLQKMLRAREKRVIIGRHTFIVRRPTPLEHEENLRKGNIARGILDFVVGWDGVTEADLVKGGDPHPVLFDAEVCAEWLSDRPDLFEPIARNVVDSFGEHVATLEASLKN